MLLLLLVSGFDGALADTRPCVCVYKLSHFLLRKSGTVIDVHGSFLFISRARKKKKNSALVKWSPPTIFFSPKKVLCENAHTGQVDLVRAPRRRRILSARAARMTWKNITPLRARERERDGI
jgi:hypothetical protein